MPAEQHEDAAAGVRPLTLTEALVPVATLLAPIVASALLFGDAGFYGPNQIALAIATLASMAGARRAGHSPDSLNAAALASTASGIDAIHGLPLVAFGLAAARIGTGRRAA